MCIWYLQNSIAFNLHSLPTFTVLITWPWIQIHVIYESKLKCWSAKNLKTNWHRAKNQNYYPITLFTCSLIILMKGMKYTKHRHNAIVKVTRSAVVLSIDRQNIFIERKPEPRVHLNPDFIDLFRVLSVS